MKYLLILTIMGLNYFTYSQNIYITPDEPGFCYNDTCIFLTAHETTAGFPQNRNYVWSTGDTTRIIKICRFGDQPLFDTLIYVDVFSLSNMYIGSDTVTVTPDLPKLYGDSVYFFTICPDTCITLEANDSGTQFNWNPIDGLNIPISRTPTACLDSSQNYSVSYKGTDECTYTDSFYINVLNPCIDSTNTSLIYTSINNISIYPTLVQDQITISSTQGQNTVIKIYSLAGQLLKEEKIYADNQILDVSDLVSGSYILKYNGDVGSKSILLTKL